MQIQNNTVAGGLTPTQTPNDAVPTLRAALAPLTGFCTFIQPLTATTGVHSICRVSAVASGDSDVANFQSGDFTAVACLATAKHEVRIGHIENSMLQQGYTSDILIPSLVNGLVFDLWNSATSLVTTANHGVRDVEVSEANFDEVELATLKQAVAGEKRTALLKSVPHSNVSDSLSRENGKWFYPGFDGGVYEFTSSQAETAHSIVATPQALAGLVTRPANFKLYPSTEITVEPVTVPELGVTIYICRWFDRASRAAWVSAECLAGFSVADPAALAYAAAPA